MPTFNWPTTLAWPVNSNWPNSFSPQSIANLALWMDGRAATFSDAGGTTAATDPAGRVRRTDQPSPLTGSWLAASDPLRPTREGVYLDFAVGAGQRLAQPVGKTLPANNATIGMSITMRDNPPGSGQFILIGNDGVTSWGVWVFSANLIFVYREGSFWNTGISIPSGTQGSFVVRFTASGAKLDYSIGGTVGKLTDGTAISARTAQSLFLGDIASGNPMHAAVSQVTAYSSALSDADTDRLLAWLLSQPGPAAFPTNAPLVVVAGHSIPRGFGLAPSSSYPFLMQPNLWATSPARLLNTAVSGYTIAQMATAYPSIVAPQLSTARAKNILLVDGPSNSVAFGSLTAAQVLTALYSYCDTARADGWKVVIVSMLPRTDAGIRGSTEADRVTVNTDIAANHASHSDAYADVASIAGMSTTTDTTGVNFQSDHVHPSVAGHALIEAVVRTAVLSLL